TDLDAQAAIDARAQPEHGRVRLARARSLRFAALRVVGDDQSVPVEHHALEARVGTHVLADLLAHETGVAIGGEAVEQDPEGLPGTERRSRDEAAELKDRREVSDEGKAGPESEQDPGAVLGGLEAELARRHRGG